MDDLQAKRVVKALLKDMLDRRGFRQNWEQIDPITKREIEAEWIRIIRDTK